MFRLKTVGFSESVVMCVGLINVFLCLFMFVCVCMCLSMFLPRSVYERPNSILFSIANPTFRFYRCSRILLYPLKPFKTSSNILLRRFFCKTPKVMDLVNSTSHNPLGLGPECHSPKLFAMCNKDSLCSDFQKCILSFHLRLISILVTGTQTCL